jgi:hypothetical protein
MAPGLGLPQEEPLLRRKAEKVEFSVGSLVYCNIPQKTPKPQTVDEKLDERKPPPGGASGGCAWEQTLRLRR